MINFIKNITNLVLFLYKISKYQILTHPENIRVPANVKFLANFICFIIYPKKFFIHPKQTFGVRLTSFLKDLGPIYIKFGQTLSTRPDLIGQDVANHLKSLQDKLPAFDTEFVKAKIEENFGTQISQIFSNFDEMLKRVGEKDFSTGQITWISPTLNQIHQLKNLETNKKTCITIQCYMYEKGDTTHYDYFDYLDDNGNVQQYEPDSDMDFVEFKKLMKQEWDNRPKTKRRNLCYFWRK